MTRATAAVRQLAALLLITGGLLPGTVTLARADAPAPATPTRTWSPADLTALDDRLGAAVAQAQAATEATEAVSARSAHLTRRIADAASSLDMARGDLDAVVRSSYMAAQAVPFPRVLRGLDPAVTLGLHTSLTRGVGRASAAVADVERRREDLAVAQAQAESDLAPLRVAAAQAEQAQESARVLLAEARRAYADQQEQLQRLAALQAALDAASAQSVLAAAPAVTARGQAAAAAEATVVQSLEATPAGQLPAGFHRTGQRLEGVASWYGPGFSGQPTSTGAPYDPERLTCAMLAVPLGTVVHVTAPSGASVNLLVDDHGPYVSGRVIDLSHAASRILGVSLGPVTVEVLERSG